jgi:hypothetical protein
MIDLGVTSDDLSIASVPDSVLVAQGASAATFTIDTTTILTQTIVGITASFNGVSQTIPLTIQPPSESGSPVAHNHSRERRGRIRRDGHRHAHRISAQRRCRRSAGER